MRGTVLVVGAVALVLAACGGRGALSAYAEQGEELVAELGAQTDKLDTE